MHCTFCTKLVLWHCLVRRCRSKKLQKCKEVVDLAEKLNDQTVPQKQLEVLAFVVAFCLYFLCSVSIMRRDLQDASAVPHKLSFLLILALILNNLPALG
jgi:Na+/citrate or Na+/malate symporter